VTLGESIDFLRVSVLCDRVDVRLGSDTSASPTWAGSTTSSSRGSTGWRRPVDTAGLADADWEIRACLDLATENDFLRGQVDLLRSLASDSGNRALPVYQILAR
jgi:hypothetical protein